MYEGIEQQITEDGREWVSRLKDYLKAEGERRRVSRAREWRDKMETSESQRRSWVKYRADEGLKKIKGREEGQMAERPITVGDSIKEQEEIWSKTWDRKHPGEEANALITEEAEDETLDEACNMAREKI